MKNTFNPAAPANDGTNIGNTMTTIAMTDFGAVQGATHVVHAVARK